MNYFLVLSGHLPVIIHEEDKKDYYAALEAWDRVQDLGALRGFLTGQAVKTWGRRLR